MKKLVLAALLATAGCATTPAPQSELAVHKKLLTLDTHLDTPLHFGRRGWDFGARHSYATDLSQVDLGRMDSGDLDGGFFVIYTAQGPVTPQGFADAKAFAFKRLGEIETTLARFPNRIALATTAADAARIDAQGKRFAYISIENSYPLGEDLSLLDEFYRRGVRLAGPVHFKNNQFADSATDAPKWHGLSPLGRQWVAEMNRLGMVIDASHASDDVFDQMVALSKTPILLSHSGARAMWNHPRNLDDDRIRKLAASGGAICVNSAYLSKMESSPEREKVSDAYEHLNEMTPAEQADLAARTHALDQTQPVQSADFETYMRSVLHIIQVAGVDHVCFGADWDGGGGVKGFEDIDALPKVTARLRAAGYSKADIQKMWSGNVLRLLRNAEAAKGR
jgi:membrane dipeptidase